MQTRKAEYEALRKPAQVFPIWRRLCFALPLVACAFLLPSNPFFVRPGVNPLVDRVLQCSIRNLHSDLSFLDGAVPISTDEFLVRRDRLARALTSSNVDAFVVEPGYTFQYYGNVSQTDWEPWEPEERPFLMVVLPQTSPSGEITAKTAFLAPHFEESRARMLGIPSQEDELDIVIWEEHWNPFQTLLKSHLFDQNRAAAPRLMIDEEMRDFITRGLESVGFETMGLTPDVELVRQVKSPAEVELLRAVNTGTVIAVRAMRPCLVPGLTENEVMNILDASLISLGFGLFFDIVLFDENAALPHGGAITGGKKLTHETMILIDVGAHYLGYSSDICRSFFIDPPTRSSGPVWNGILQIVGLATPTDDTERGLTAHDKQRHAEKLKVWSIVFDAQTAAEEAFRPNRTAASIDIAARSVIEDAGYGAGFTHRVGHGIGIKAHESPYLNKWNHQVLLYPGMVFTNEPGIYLEGNFGVRHEDIYLVTATGDAELLTGQRARGPYEP
ncbi:metallopeptidase family M24 [Thozetella sp. PMI_491]|nr:metallopeptidase family M24 [Thozetella sp. PMI_491]